MSRAFLLLTALLAAVPIRAGAAVWRFAVSGDSRDCGDVIMPAIADRALADGPQFYWHLGDFRRIYGIDADIRHEPTFRDSPLDMPSYQDMAWDDFIDNQLAPFGGVTVYLGIGNHETIPPKTRDQYVVEFSSWLAGPGVLDRQGAHYHWRRDGLDFINLDNATTDQFDAAQLAWLEDLLAKDQADPSITTLVVGMHEALPGSLAAGHSMEQSPRGLESGARVYEDLFKAQQAGKRVYVLASHSHFFMEGVFNSARWRQKQEILPGWIVGTAGAVRYPLPDTAKDAVKAEAKVYGYLLGTVAADGQISFDFKRIAEKDVPAAVRERYTPDFVRWCFADNAELGKK